MKNSTVIRLLVYGALIILSTCVIFWDSRNRIFNYGWQVSGKTDPVTGHGISYLTSYETEGFSPDPDNNFTGSAYWKIKCANDKVSYVKIIFSNEIIADTINVKLDKYPETSVEVTPFNDQIHFNHVKALRGLGARWDNILTSKSNIIIRVDENNGEDVFFQWKFSKNNAWDKFLKKC